MNLPRGAAIVRERCGIGDPHAPCEAVLIDLENRWVAALVRANTAGLDAIFAATCVDTDEGGARTDKAGLLAVLKSGQLKMTSIKLSNMHV